MAEALGISFDVGVSVFVFLVHGLYAINKEYKWTQSDEWLEAQKVIFELVLSWFTKQIEFILVYVLSYNPMF